MLMLRFLYQMSSFCVFIFCLKIWIPGMFRFCHRGEYLIHPFPNQPRVKFRRWTWRNWVRTDLILMESGNSGQMEIKSGLHQKWTPFTGLGRLGRKATRPRKKADGFVRRRSSALQWWIPTKFEDWFPSWGVSGELIGLLVIHGRWRPLPQPASSIKITARVGGAPPSLFAPPETISPLWPPWTNPWKYPRFKSLDNSINMFGDISFKVQVAEGVWRVFWTESSGAANSNSPHYMLIRADMCQYVLICADMYQYVPICANMCWGTPYMPIYADIRHICPCQFLVESGSQKEPSLRWVNNKWDISCFILIMIQIRWTTIIKCFRLLIDQGFDREQRLFWKIFDAAKSYLREKKTQRLNSNLIWRSSS